MPREFVKDGRQFITRCSKRTSSLSPSSRSKNKRKSRAESLRSLVVKPLLRSFEANRKRDGHPLLSHQHAHTHWNPDMTMYKLLTPPLTADKREFLRISQAVGMGFLIMGVIGYIVKLSKCLSSTTAGML